ncbi:hypothetical protein ASD55_17730 [Rhodanobacter sp. Root561]|uniref:hypothetical protein n=1 Tax=Rhodanobacter sp. Root561 TaxID=1736560 RepID=UPI000701D77D|nr:hypothetical protein [Rhodanobacter sp. Root561]KQZ77886.1 hypothetical protein ASD55_17730 [Rhodanobacter sp. Root561]
MKYLVATLLLMLLTSCASLPSPQQAAAADYGSYPSNYEQVVKAYYDNTLKDPSSAQYRDIALPKQFWLGNRFTGAQYGYMVCVTLNAKNSYGAYIGFQTDGLLIRDGVVIQYVPKGDWFGKQMC